MALSGIIKANLHEKTKNLIDSNKEFEDKIASFSTILTYFSFSEKDVANVIDRICQNGKIKLADQLIELLKENYLDGEIFSANKDRVKSLKRILLETIELYEEDSKNVSSQIKEVLALAKQLNLSPYRIALKTNIRMATVENFQNTLEALTKEKYNLGKKEESTLFSQEEYNEIMQQCASIACRVSADNLKEIINLLKKLSYDSENGCYHFDVKSLLKETPSLLAVSADKMENTIALLDLICEVNNITKAELLDKVAKNPSILMISSEKFNENLEICQNIFIELSKKLDKNMTTGKFMKSLNHDKLQKRFYNFDNLEAITDSKTEILILKAELLEKFAGAQNAMNCMLDKAILSTDLTKLGFVLAYIANADNKNKNNHLKTTFVANPAKFLNVLSSQKMPNEDDDETKNSSRKNREYHKKEENVVDKNFPPISSSELVKTIDSYKSTNPELYEKFALSVKTFAEDFQADKKAKKEHYKKLREMNRLAKNPQNNEPSNDKSNSETDTADLADNKNDDNSIQENDENKDKASIDDIIAGIEEIKSEEGDESFSKVMPEDYIHGVPQYHSVQEKSFSLIFKNIINFINSLILKIKKDKRKVLLEDGLKEIIVNEKLLEEIIKALEKIEQNNLHIVHYVLALTSTSTFELKQWASVAKIKEKVSLLNVTLEEVISSYKRNKKQFKFIDSKLNEVFVESFDEFMQKTSVSDVSEINHRFNIQDFMTCFLIGSLNFMRTYLSDQVFQEAFNDNENALVAYRNSEYDANPDSPDIIKDIEYLRKNNINSVSISEALSIFLKKLCQVMKNEISKLAEKKDDEDIYFFLALQRKNEDKNITVLSPTDCDTNLAKTKEYINEIEEIIKQQKDTAKLYYGPNLEMYIDLGITVDDKPAMALLEASHKEYYIEPTGDYATIDPNSIHIVQVEYFELPTSNIKN